MADELANQEENPILAKIAAEGSKELTAADMTQIQKQLRNLEHGHYAMVPIHCRGKACRYENICPLLKAGVSSMVGQQCPLEEHLLKTWIQHYQQSLNVDPTNTIEMNLVCELAKIEIYSARAAHRVGSEDIIINQVIGVSDKGEPIYREELHPVLGLAESQDRRKLRLLEAFLATRQSLAEAGGSGKGDQSTHAAELADIVRKAQRNLASRAEKIKADNAKNITPPEPPTT
jgi:hypothetical protein